MSAQITTATRATLPGSHPAVVNASTDQGRTSASTQLTGMKLAFSRSAAQEADLQQLLASQQDPSSPQYHAWLTPDQFAARFGMSDEDLGKAQAWLQQEGFKVQSVARSRNQIFFSGTVAQAEASFSTEIHNFSHNGQTFFAPAADVSLPSALAGVVQNVGNLTSLRPHSHARLRQGENALTAHFTSSQSGSHYLTPSDVRTIYDINPAYSSGYNGSGQTIAVVGQSAIVTTDIEHFQSAAGLTVKDPTIILVPNSGTTTVYTGDESESDIDLEYSAAIAPGATIKFIYTGNSQNYSVIDSEEYAVDNNVAPIISVSYGDCETALGQAEYATENAVFEQAAAQGQTVIAASGDNGSSDCAEDNRSGLYVDYPASSQYVTGMGGTEFPSADVASSNTTYWTSASGSDVISSAKSYIPEVAWNESDSSGISAGGGGTSMYTARPSWQAGVTGIASGSYRLVPDISLNSAISLPGYLYCSSDSEGTGITGSCSHGFRDTNNTYLTVAGGTSFAAPIFAGMVALINQATGSSGQGVINPTLYKLASKSSNYASAFHDITGGTNACVTGYRYCSTTASGSYSAGTGYDEATGLGSVDFYNLLNAWSSGTSSTATLATSTTSLSAQTATPASGASDVITITVASASTSASGTPTGSVSILVDGSAATTLTLSNGTASYTFSSTTAGSHTVAATYSGDSTFASSSGTITLTVTTAVNPSASFTVAATNISVTAGSTGTSTVTVTPANGYTGTVDWSVAVSPTISNACYSISNLKVTGTAATATTLTVYTSSSQCTSLTPLSVRGGKHAFGAGTSSATTAMNAPRPQRDPSTVMFACASLCFLGVSKFRRRRLGLCCALVFTFAAGLALSGCGGSGTATTSPTTSVSNAATGAYTITLTGQDSGSASLSSSTNLTLSIQ